MSEQEEVSLPSEPRERQQHKNNVLLLIYINFMRKTVNQTLQILHGYKRSFKTFDYFASGTADMTDQGIHNQQSPILRQPLITLRDFRELYVTRRL